MHVAVLAKGEAITMPFLAGPVIPLEYLRALDAMTMRMALEEDRITVESWGRFALL